MKERKKKCVCVCITSHIALVSHFFLEISVFYNLSTTTSYIQPSIIIIVNCSCANFSSSTFFVLSFTLNLFPLTLSTYPYLIYLSTYYYYYYIFPIILLLPYSVTLCMHLHTYISIWIDDRITSTTL